MRTKFDIYGFYLRMKIILLNMISKFKIGTDYGTGDVKPYLLCIISERYFCLSICFGLVYSVFVLKSMDLTKTISGSSTPLVYYIYLGLSYRHDITEMLLKGRYTP